MRQGANRAPGALRSGDNAPETVWNATGCRILAAFGSNGEPPAKKEPLTMSGSLTERMGTPLGAYRTDRYR